jgi:uncharacterized membrane protein
MLIHIAAATGAVVLGGLTLALRKGTPLHRLFGRAWILLMLTTALVSFGIRTKGHFTPIHILSAVTVVVVCLSIYAAMRGRISAHRRGMRLMYISLLIAGAFTLLPGRRLGALLWQAVGVI